jgi:tripartite-type tricarboxylate transporter receptor subunit TctC
MGTRAVQVGMAVTLLAAIAGCGSEDEAEPAGGGAEAASPFEGERIEFVVPYEPGGGYDVYARAIAPYLADCLGGEAIVVNQPGAGGLLATNQTAVAKPDGLRIQILNMPGVVSSQIAGAEGVQFDLNDFSWIGRVAAPPDAAVVGSDGGLQTFPDIADSTEPVKFVATGPGSNEYISAAVLAEAYDIPHEIITGFVGSGEARTAVVAGNADVHILPFDSQLSAVESGDVQPVVVVAEEQEELLPDTPPITEFEPATAEGQELVQSLITLGETGRGVAAPPGLPEDRLAALRAGFTCALENDELLQQLESQDRPVDYLEGTEYQELVSEVLNPAPEFERVVTESF